MMAGFFWENGGPCSPTIAALIDVLYVPATVSFFLFLIILSYYRVVLCMLGLLVIRISLLKSLDQ